MRLKVPPSGWLSQLLAAFGIVYQQGYEPALGEVVTPVYVVNPTNVVNNVSQFGDTWTDNSRAFIGSEVQVLSAGNKSSVQLFNPVASGVNVYIDRITAQVTTASIIELHRYDTALATLSAQFLNKQAGAGAGGGVIRKTNVGAVSLGTIVGQWDVAGVTNVELLNARAAPVKLVPGSGIHVSHQGTGNDVIATFEWRESPI